MKWNYKSAICRHHHAKHLISGSSVSENSVVWRTTKNVPKQAKLPVNLQDQVSYFDTQGETLNIENNEEFHLETFSTELTEPEGIGVRLK